MHVGKAISGLLMFAVAAGSPAAAQAPVSPPHLAAAAEAEAKAAALKKAWLEDHGWRYAKHQDADWAFTLLLVRQSPWPEWHQRNATVLPPGTRFEMALSPGQAPDRPGRFGTFERIASVRFVRDALAVKTEWKPQIDRVVTFEITEPMLVDSGLVGPQIDLIEGRYLKGGASQFEMLVPAAERMRYLRQVSVRQIE